jgi:hypothetical protein
MALHFFLVAQVCARNRAFVYLTIMAYFKNSHYSIRGREMDGEWFGLTTGR